VAARCRHQPACPGCPRFGERTIAASARQRLEALALAAGIAPPEFSESIGFGYRHRVRLSVRGTPAAPRLGIFEEGSHRLVHIPDCPLHHPAIEEVSRELLDAAARLRMPPFREGEHAGLLRTVQLAVERPSGKVQVVLVLRAEPEASLSEIAPAIELCSELSGLHLVHSLWLNFQPERSNSLLGPVFRHMVGPEATLDWSGGARVFYPPGAFGQANPAQHDRAVAQIHAQVGTEPIVEFYAGVGTIGLGLLARGNRVVFNEVSPGSLAGLELGLSALPGHQATVRPGPAGQTLSALEEVGAGATAIVDPPRKGLDGPLIEALAGGAVRQLLYLSCGLDSFQRDAARLQAGGLRMTHLTAYPYFPFTEHVETLGVFERR
jgi:23S rRNA (uracil1939-C5)-methyltransferase